MINYTEIELEVARVLGWIKGLNYWHLTEEPMRSTYTLPRWLSDNSSAFDLMAEQDCYPYVFGKDKEYIGVQDTKIWISISDHTDKETAIRYAIAIAVISKLDR